ncbi:hypothetical protein ACFVU3_28580 [Streptomyces sp. NPDC058052]|uniref:hypothetical protein n=1 Tax=Streptomyces sp. NPDC058052 TaxID=3346316 RepID=UPI0036F18945
MTDVEAAIHSLSTTNLGANVARGAVLNVVRGKVGVPDTGTYIVADGVVYEAAPWSVKERLRPGSRLWKWTLEAEEPPAPVLEEGKTCRSRNDHGASVSRRFAVETVRGEGEGRIAFGFMSGGGAGDRWTTRVEIGDWEEVRSHAACRPTDQPLTVRTRGRLSDVGDQWRNLPRNR